LETVALDTCAPVANVIGTLQVKAFFPFPPDNFTFTVPELYPLPTLVMLTLFTFPEESKVAVPAKPLPPPGGSPAARLAELLAAFAVHAPVCDTSAMQPLLLMVAVVVALRSVSVVGEVVTLRVGVVPDL